MDQYALVNVVMVSYYTWNVCRCVIITLLRRRISHPISIYNSSFFELACDETCGCGYTFTELNVDDGGSGDKVFSYPGTTIDKCADECRWVRDGCTSFEFKDDGSGSCGTYTSGDDNLKSTQQLSGWYTCIKGITIF